MHPRARLSAAARASLVLGLALACGVCGESEVAESIASTVIVDGVELHDLTDLSTVIVVEETGEQLDHGPRRAGGCKSRVGLVGPIRALLSCSLHAAVHHSNSLPPHEKATILVAPGRFHLLSPLPEITHSVSFVGATADFSKGPVATTVLIEGGSATLPLEALKRVQVLHPPVIDCMHDWRFLSIGAGLTVSVTGLKVVNGYGDRGGCILQAPSESGLTRLENVHFESCTAAYGGAVYSESQLRIAKSTFSSNRASFCGGAVYVLERMLSAEFSSFKFNMDECSRRPDGVVILEAITAKQSEDNVIVVGSAIALDAATWEVEDRRLRSEQRESARIREEIRLGRRSFGEETGRHL